MAVNLDISTDHEVFDNTQTLSFQAASGGSPVNIAGCTSGPLSRKQIELVGPIGVETVMRNFSLPIANFAGTPKNGDTLTDTDNVVWNIQAADKSTINNRWRCVCQRNN